MLASLNHPNIAALYELLESDDLRILVMEGQTLTERVSATPLLIEDSVVLRTTA